MLSQTLNELLQYLALVLSVPFSVRNEPGCYVALIAFILLPHEKSNILRLLNIVGT